jgi:hypothetical protein
MIDQGTAPCGRYGVLMRLHQKASGVGPCPPLLGQLKPQTKGTPPYGETKELEHQPQFTLQLQLQLQPSSILVSNTANRFTHRLHLQVALRTP